MDKIPKYIKCLILSKLPTFQNIKQVSKYWYYLTGSNELYSYLNKSQNSELITPNHVSEKAWYDRTKNSGFVTLVHPHGNEKLSLKHIWNIKWCVKVLYAIDIYDRIYTYDAQKNTQI